MQQQIDASAEQVQDGYIDTHVHLWTADFGLYPLAPGYSKEQIRPASFTPNDIFALANPLGVDRMVLIQMVFYGFDNSYMLDCIKKHPHSFSGIAQVNDQGINPAEEMRRLRQVGVRGVRIFPPHRGASGWLDGPGMRTMWAAAAEERMAICPLVDVDDLPAIDHMCHLFPHTSVVIDHFARIGGDGQFRDSDLKLLCDMAKHRQTYVKLSAFYFLGAKRPPYDDIVPMIRRLLETFGPERLMWATDSPFQAQVPNSYCASLELIRDRLSFVSQSDRQRILAGTAASLFFT